MLKKIISIINETIPNQKLRENFLVETQALALEMIKITCILGPMIFLFFGILDIFVFPKILFKLWALRLIPVVLCAVLYFSLKTDFVKRNTFNFSMFLLLLGTLNIATMCYLTGGPVSIYYAGINLSFLFMIFILPLDLKRVLIVCVITYIYYMLPLLYLKPGSYNVAYLIANNFFLVHTMMLGIVGTYYKNRLRLHELSIRTDLAEAKKQVEETNQKLQKFDMMKDEFMANVSHELRTPLTSIIAPLETLISKIDSQNKTVACDEYMLNQMTLNAKKLLKLINDLLDFTKLEAGKMQIKCSKVDIKKVIDELIISIESLVQQAQLKIEKKLPKNEILVYADMGKIEKVFLNLLSNAIKFTQEKGTITVSVEEDEKTVKISVADTGIGIPKEELPKMFDRFHQVDGSATRNYGGTGIGLNLAKELVELHKGNIKVESELNKGSVFTVELLKGTKHLSREDIDEIKPQEDERRFKERRKDDRRYPDVRTLQMADIQTNQVTKQKLIDELKKQDLHGKTAQATVQIVEDDAGVIALIRDTLKSNYIIRVAFDGKEGWNMICKEPPDLVISDLMMPGFNGFELTEKVKTTERTKHIPVIILTARGELNFKIQGLEMGADDYLAKPFNRDELRARVKSLLNVRKLENELAKTNKALAQSYEKLRDAEAQLIHTEKIRSLGIMLMGLAHEFHNPLSFIDGGAHALQRLINEEKNISRHKDINKMLGSIDEGVKRCFMVMTELRKFSQKDKINYEEYDIKENIESSLLLLNHLLNSRIKIIKEFKTDKTVACVPGHISQVVFNILHNAITAIKDAGTITIRTWDDGQQMFLEFFDTGEGIKKEDIKKVFDPFFTTRDPNKGMGLGLTVSYKVVSEHGGKIDIDSEEGVGTKIIVSLPLKQAERRG
ncbi:MAG: ATP-binding protein [bacterium]